MVTLVLPCRSAFCKQQKKGISPCIVPSVPPTTHIEAADRYTSCKKTYLASLNFSFFQNLDDDVVVFVRAKFVLQLGFGGGIADILGAVAVLRKNGMLSFIFDTQGFWAGEMAGWGRIGCQGNRARAFVRKRAP